MLFVLACCEMNKTLWSRIDHPCIFCNWAGQSKQKYVTHGDQSECHVLTELKQVQVSNDISNYDNIGEFSSDDNIPNRDNLQLCLQKPMWFVAEGVIEFGGV
jgi:hypothetical protein